MVLARHGKLVTLGVTKSVLAACVAISLIVFGSPVFAADPPSDFSLQVTPSPLFTTLKPGTDTMLELKIRNAGTGSEDLRIDPRTFAINGQTGEVTLDDTKPSEIAQWIKFSAEKFSVKPGEWYTQRIHVSLPKDTGFSYSLALIISRTNNPKSIESGRLIKGSVAVFTLINVDRPGATRRLEVESFSMSAGVYEYLPATINMKFKNTGNTIIQPYGNVFIQRGSGNEIPLGVLPVNNKGGYILPGSERLLTANWSEGFPVYQTSVGTDGVSKTNEVWDWSKLSNFRIGQYTSKLVAVYNDGHRDVPIEKTATFWVLPWKIILGGLLVLVLVGIGVWTMLRRIWLLLSHRKHGKGKKQKQEQEDA